jgi:hypothetical protein
MWRDRDISKGGHDEDTHLVSRQRPVTVAAAVDVGDLRRFENEPFGGAFVPSTIGLFTSKHVVGL